MEELVKQLKRHEGLRLKPYKCTANKTSIGVGRNLDDIGISEKEAEILLLNDIEEAKRQLAAHFPWTADLDEVRLAALINFTFNVGIGTVSKFVNAMALLKDGKFDMVFDTVSSADSRDKAANYESQIRSSEPPIIKVAHGSQAEKGVDKHNYVVFGGIFISWMRALIKRLSRKSCCCTCNFFPKGFELFWIDMPHGTRYLKDLQELCDNQGLRPKVSKVLPFERPLRGQNLSMVTLNLVPHFQVLFGTVPGTINCTFCIPWSV